MLLESSEEFVGMQDRQDKFCGSALPCSFVNKVQQNLLQCSGQSNEEEFFFF